MRNNDIKVCIPWFYDLFAVIESFHVGVTNLWCVRGQYHTNYEQTQSVEGII